MEEKIFQRLVALLGKKSSISERTLRNWSGRLSKKVADESALTDEFYGDVLEELKDFEGQLNHAVATAVRGALDKPKSTDEKSKPADEKSKPTDTPSADNVHLSDDFVKRFDVLERSLSDFLASQKRSSFELSVRNGLEGAGLDDKFLLDYALLKVGIDDATDVAGNVSAIRKVYDELLSEQSVRSGVPMSGNGDFVGQRSVADVDEAIKEDMKLFNLNV